MTASTPTACGFSNTPRQTIHINPQSPTMTATLSQPGDIKSYKQLPNDELQRRIQAARRELGSKLLILGHHYQQDEVVRAIRPAGRQLSIESNGRSQCRLSVHRVCGVHLWRKQPTSSPTGPRNSLRVMASVLQSCCLTWLLVARWLIWPRLSKSKIAGKSWRIHRHQRYHAGDLYQLGC